jgi:hypothetical protein
VPVAIEGDHLPTEVGYDTIRSQVKTLVRTKGTQMSFPETISDSLCRNSSVVQTHSFISCLGGWSQPFSIFFFVAKAAATLPGVKTMKQNTEYQ